jgi:uncharacterized protein (TIGR02145 family)
MIKSKFLMPNFLGLLVAFSFSCKKDTQKEEEDPNFADNLLTGSLSYGIVNAIEGNSYKTIKIGGKVWMAENLKTTRYKDGTPIPNVTDNSAWANLKSGGYCWYKNDAATYKATYGALYNWYSVNTGKLCPAGWHVPSKSEWANLYNALGSTDNVGYYMKSTTGWLVGGNGSNSSGFSGHPSGLRLGDEDFGSFNDNIDRWAFWWSSSEYNTTYAWYLVLYYEDWEVGTANFNKGDGYSIRYLKD